MDYFHTDDHETIALLATVLSLAETHDRRVRISVSGDTLKFKIGEGMWSHSIASTPDPYRDLRTERPTVLP